MSLPSGRPRRKFVAEQIGRSSPPAAGVFLPARGPFIRTGQNDTRFGTMSWSDAKFLASREGLLTDTLYVTWGSIVYQESDKGGCEIVAYHYDTSD